MNKGMLLKIIAIAVAVVYTVLPVDIIPDVIPIVGWLDDLGVDVSAIVIAFLKFSFADEQNTKSTTSIADTKMQQVEKKAGVEKVDNNKLKEIERLEDMDNF